MYWAKTTRKNAIVPTASEFIFQRKSLWLSGHMCNVQNSSFLHSHLSYKPHTQLVGLSHLFLGQQSPPPKKMQTTFEKEERGFQKQHATFGGGSKANNSVEYIIAFGSALSSMQHARGS